MEWTKLDQIGSFRTHRDQTLSFRTRRGWLCPADNGRDRNKSQNWPILGRRYLGVAIKLLSSSLLDKSGWSLTLSSSAVATQFTKNLLANRKFWSVLYKMQYPYPLLVWGLQKNLEMIDSHYGLKYVLGLDRHVILRPAHSDLCGRGMGVELYCTRGSVGLALRNSRQFVSLVV